MNSSQYTAIKNFAALVNWFGRWPSFDDFEVVSMQLTRGKDDESHASLTVEFLGFQTDLLIESADRKHCLIVMLFSGLENVVLEGFNHQNAINGFVVEANWSDRLQREMFTVELVQGFGVGAKFDCEEIELIEVTPKAVKKI